MGRWPLAHADGKISQYCLELTYIGKQRFYTWNCLLAPGAQRELRILIDLNTIYMPESEIEKLAIAFAMAQCAIVSIAFANCHPKNQREIKRRLKASNISLYTKSAFFTDIAQAKHWLATRTGNR